MFVVICIDLFICMKGYKYVVKKVYGFDVKAGLLQHYPLYSLYSPVQCRGAPLCGWFGVVCVVWYVWCDLVLWYGACVV